MQLKFFRLWLLEGGAECHTHDYYIAFILNITQFKKFLYVVIYGRNNMTTFTLEGFSVLGFFPTQFGEKGRVNCPIYQKLASLIFSQNLVL